MIGSRVLSQDGALRCHVGLCLRVVLLTAVPLVLPRAGLLEGRTEITGSGKPASCPIGEEPLWLHVLQQPSQQTPHMVLYHAPTGRSLTLYRRRTVC